MGVAVKKTYLTLTDYDNSQKVLRAIDKQSISCPANASIKVFAHDIGVRVGLML